MNLDKMNLNRIKVGDKFSTESKLLTTVGFDKPTDGKTKKYQIRELKRYLTYDKTGKMSRGKITNEIVVTEIYDMPKPKIDNRSNNGGNNTNAISDYIEYRIKSELYKHGVIYDSKNNLIKQMELIDNRIADVIYGRVKNPDIDNLGKKEKNFITDFYLEIMKSYKQRLNRIINKITARDGVKYYTNYRLLHDTDNHYTFEDVKADKPKAKIDKIKTDVEFIFGVEKAKDKWKIYNNRSTIQKFNEQFVEGVNNLLHCTDIVNVYQVIYLSVKTVDEPQKHFSETQFCKAQDRFATRTIQTLFNKKVKYFKQDGNYTNVYKYNPEHISNDCIRLCRDMLISGEHDYEPLQIKKQIEDWDESKLTKAQMEQVTLGIKTVDDFKPECIYLDEVL